MIASEKPHQYRSDYKQFLFKKKLEVNKKKHIFFSEQMRNSGICIYDYAYSFFGEDFYPMCNTGKKFISSFKKY